MGGPDVSEIRRVLQVFDASANASGRQAVGMLEGVTKLVAKDPGAYGLLDDAGGEDAWQSAGGASYCEAEEFPSKLLARWLEALSKPGFANAGYDKDELETLKAKVSGWIVQLEKKGLEARTGPCS